MSATLRRVWLIATFVAVCGAASAAEQPAFETWVSDWTRGSERTTALKHYEAMAADPLGGALGVVLAMRKQIAALEPGSEPERKWRATMLCQMESLPAGALDLTRPGEPLTPETKQAIATGRNEFAKLGAGQFKPIESPRDGSYGLFTGTTSTCGSIAIGRDDQSVTAQEIYRTGDLLGQLNEDASIPALESMQRTVAESHAKWTKFFENAIYDGFPWELYGNEIMRSWIPQLRGTLAQPPSAQLRIVHPTPLMAVATEGETTFKANFGVEVLGWRSFDTTTYAPRWGVSALMSLRESREESTGYGLLATFRGWSIGAIQRDTAEKNNEIQIVVGIDVAEWIQKKRAAGGTGLGGFANFKKELESGWDEAKQAAGESPAP